MSALEIQTWRKNLFCFETVEKKRHVIIAIAVKINEELRIVIYRRKMQRVNRSIRDKILIKKEWRGQGMICPIHIGVPIITGEHNTNFFGRVC